MLKQFIEQLSAAIAPAQPGDRGNEDRDLALRKATAVLMVDVAIADREFDARELERILELVGLHFDLDGEDARSLVSTAETMAKDMVSLYEFTQLLHQNLNEPEKVKLIDMLWQVAYADGDLDKHEDSLVLKIGDLLHVNRARVMRSKDDARRQTGGDS